MIKNNDKDSALPCVIANPGMFRIPESGFTSHFRWFYEYGTGVFRFACFIVCTLTTRSDWTSFTMMVLIKNGMKNI